MQKFKVVCPHPENHGGKDKILLAIELDGTGKRGSLWASCGYYDKQRGRVSHRWYRIDISRLGAAMITEMPDNYHLDFERLPTLVCEYGKRSSQTDSDTDRNK